jgi:hypothetical protein
MVVHAGYLLHQLEEKENGLLRKGAWSRRKSDSREQVIKELQHRLSPGLLIPEGRLEHLIELALQSQVQTKHPILHIATLPTNFCGGCPINMM